MSDARDLIPQDHRSQAPATGEAPTLSETLVTWLAEQGIDGDFREICDSGVANLQESVHHAWRQHDRFMEAETACKVIQGYYLTLIRAASKRDFQKGLLERDIHPRTANRRMELFRTFQMLGDLEQVRRLGALGQRRTLLLSSLGEELPDFLEGREVDGLTYEEVKATPVRDLEEWQKQQAEHDEYARKLLASNENLKVQNRTLKEHLTEARRQLDAPHNDLPLPSWCSHAREESIAQASRINLALDFLEHVLTEQVLRAPRGDLELHELEAAQHMAAGTLYQALVPLQARMGVLLAQMRNEFGPNVTGDLLPAHVPDAKEAKNYAKALKAVLGTDLTAVSDRQAKRKAELMQGPGRRPETSEHKAAREGRQ